MNVLFVENQKLVYLTSVNGAEFLVDPTAKQDQAVAKQGYIIDPDISAVKDLPQKYWKLNGRSVIPMTKAERKTVDDSEVELEAQRKQDLEYLDVKTLANVLIVKGLITKEDLLKGA